MSLLEEEDEAFDGYISPQKILVPSNESWYHTIFDPL
jgi:hypothetical protein